MPKTIHDRRCYEHMCLESECGELHHQSDPRCQQCNCWLDDEGQCWNCFGDDDMGLRDWEWLELAEGPRDVSDSRLPLDYVCHDHQCLANKCGCLEEAQRITRQRCGLPMMSDGHQLVCPICYMMPPEDSEKPLAVDPYAVAIVEQSIIDAEEEGIL